jgi:hypothetical protein
VVQVWEAPRRRPEYRGFRYVVSADSSDGIGKCRACADVWRVGTLLDPEEQVAQFVSTTCPPIDFAYIIDALGRAYPDGDGFPARVAVEVNGHGHTVQSELQAHLDYPHFYRREKLDYANRAKRFTPTYGWHTTAQTRPEILNRFVTAVATRDPVTGAADCVINSPITLDEMRGFYSDSGHVVDASASKDGYDDCILTAAIGHTVCWYWLGGERAPIADQRRQRSLTQSREAETGIVSDWRNSDLTAAEMRAGMTEDVEAGYDVDVDPALLSSF